jgi:hypothetical protein
MKGGIFISDSDLGSFYAPSNVATYQYAINDCASTLRGKVSDSAMWAVNFAEYHQTLGLITGSLEEVAKLTRALLTRDAAYFLQFFTRRGRLLHLKDLLRGGANYWLAWSFGIKPLMDDIYAGIDILQNPIKAVNVTARKSYEGGATYHTGNASIYTDDTWHGQNFCRMGVQVTVSNPNLYLAKNLGLTNPLGLVWELIPFSFVVDWFVTVGQFFENGTAWQGLTVTKPWTTYGRKGSGTKTRYNVFDDPSVRLRIAIANFAFVERRLSIVESAIVVRPWKLWGWQRCANAAAVASQLLLKVRT